MTFIVWCWCCVVVWLGLWQCFNQWLKCLSFLSWKKMTHNIVPTAQILPFQTNVIHMEMEIKISWSSPNVPNFRFHFHPDFWRELTNPLLFPRQNTSDSWDCCQGIKSQCYPLNKTNNLIFLWHFPKLWTSIYEKIVARIWLEKVSKSMKIQIGR